MIEMITNVGVYIISRSDAPLTPKEFESLKKQFPVTVVQATLPEQVSEDSFYSACGVEPLEMVISISHHRARSTALKRNQEWTLILEEDAIINFDRHRIEMLICAIGRDFDLGTTKIGIHLFPEQFGVLTGSKNAKYLRVLHQPDFAVGYMLNFDALKWSVDNFNSRDVEIADWPKYIKMGIKWFAPLNSLVFHPDLKLPTTQSSTKRYRDSRSSESLLKKLFNPRILHYLILRSTFLLGGSFGSFPINSEKIRSVRLYF
jgi:hypothetical protein